MLVGSIAKRCEQLLGKVPAKYRAEILALEIMPDHVHGLVEVDPQFGIHRLVKKLISSQRLRQDFGTLRSRLPTLGTNRIHSGWRAPGGHKTIC